MAFAKYGTSTGTYLLGFPWRKKNGLEPRIVTEEKKLIEEAEFSVWRIFLRNSPIIL
jgi:hypothetical protein